MADGPRRARKLLARHGILLVTEVPLPGPYLDGAAMLSVTGHPVIGMTLRYDRLDSFWFVLFHEHGHVYLYLFEGLRYDFFVDDGSTAEGKLEREADRFALHNLIPDDQWDKCLSRFTLKTNAVLRDAEAIGIDPSIVAGRVRKEQGNHKILSRLVGHGKVRAQYSQGAGDHE